MEIKKETKAKVFAQYLGQRCLSGHWLVGVNFGNEITRPLLMTENKGSTTIDWEADFNMDMLELKPLSSITDDDAIEVAKIIRKDEEFKISSISKDSVIIESKDGFVTIFLDFGITSVYKEYESQKIDRCPESFIDDYKIVSVYLYLQSKGYDLPNYLLGGKTLKETGLATYEK